MDRLDRIEKILEKLALSQEKREKERDREMKEREKERDRQMKERDREMKERNEEMKKREKERDREMKERNKEMEKRDREMEKVWGKLALSKSEEEEEMKEIRKELGGMGRTKGEALEYSFFTSFRNSLILEKNKYDKIYTKLKNKYVLEGRNNQQEFDIVLENGKTIAIIEVKAKPDLEDLDDLERIRKAYIPCFPMDKGKKVIIYMGSSNYNDEIVNQAKKKKIKLLTLNNGVVKVLKGDDKRKKYEERENL